MLSYHDYTKTKVKIELSIADAQLVQYMMRCKYKELLKEGAGAATLLPYSRIANAIESETDKIVYGR